MERIAGWKRISLASTLYESRRFCEYDECLTWNHFLTNVFWIVRIFLGIDMIYNWHCIIIFITGFINEYDNNQLFIGNRIHLHRFVFFFRTSELSQGESFTILWQRLSSLNFWKFWRNLRSSILSLLFWSTSFLNMRSIKGPVRESMEKIEVESRWICISVHLIG